MAYVKLKTLFQTDIEEAKVQEIAKMQQAMDALQSKLDEANAHVLEERDAAQKAIVEATTVVQETQVPVEDTAKIEALTAEMEKLKVMAISCDLTLFHT